MGYHPDPMTPLDPLSPFHLGPWLVSPQLLEIRDGEEVRRLGQKVMAALVALARQRGQVMTKDALIGEVWEGAFTTDEAVAAVVYELRKSLGDDAREPRFVETIRGSGYRLVMKVSPWAGSSVEDSPLKGVPVESPSLEDQASERIPRRGPKRWLWAALGGLVVIVMAVFFLISREGAARSSEVDSMPAIRSLAVLPVSNFAAATSELGLADALADMLVADLDRMCPVDIASGLSVRGGPDRWSLDEVTAQLGVDAIVESSVLRSGDRVWIAVQLVETESGRLLWSRSYDRQGSDDLAILREVALDVASEVRARLPAEVSSDSPALAD